MKTVPSPLPNKNFAEVLECANERIPRRHALATSHWQRYVSNQNTVAKYRPCSSTFSGIIHFAHCQKLLACRGSLKRNSPSGQISKHRTEKDRDRVTETCYRHYASVFLMSGILTLLFFIAPKEKNTIYTICQAGYICGSEKLLWQIFVAGRCPLLKRQRSGQELLVMCRRGAL